MSAYDEALVITARITAGFFLVGCGGTIADPEPTSTIASPPAKATASAPIADPAEKPLGPDCTTILDRIEADWSWYSKTDPKVLAACCAEYGNKTRPACTPWGPPMPPEMIS